MAGIVKVLEDLCCALEHLTIGVISSNAGAIECPKGIPCAFDFFGNSSHQGIEFYGISDKSARKLETKIMVSSDTESVGDFQTDCAICEKWCVIGI